VRTSKGPSATCIALGPAVLGHPAGADVVIRYNEYGASPTIARGHGTSVDPKHPGYGAMRIFIQKVIDYTDEHGPDALPPGQKVVFQRDQSVDRSVNALRAGVQFANSKATSGPKFSEPRWGFIYNSVPFGMDFQHTLAWLYEGKGIELAQAMLDRQGGTQIVFPVVGSTMQGSGYFPRPIGKPSCTPGDAECERQGNGIGLAGLCTSGWRIRYLSPPEDIVSRACDILVRRGAIAAKTLVFYPAVGGQSVLLPMQRRTIQGFEFINPHDDFVDFFPVKGASAARPLGDPDSGALDCSPAVPFPIPPGTPSNCTQNIGQIGARYAHFPGWHQPFLLSWMHVDKAVWDGLIPAQRAAILRAAREAVLESYNATESVACRKLKDILDINDGVGQRNLDGTPRMADGKPVSADMVLAPWPEEALKVLLEARNEHLAALEGPQNAEAKSEVQKDFSAVLKSWRDHAQKAGVADKFEPGVFPAKTGLVAGETCALVR